MKKTLIIAMMIMLFNVSLAQDVYTCGYYINGYGMATAAVWKNGEILYKQSEQGEYLSPSIAVTQNHDVYWTYNDKVYKNEELLSSYDGMIKHLNYDENHYGLIVTGQASNDITSATLWDEHGQIMYSLDTVVSNAYKTLCYNSDGEINLYTCGYTTDATEVMSATVWLNGGALCGGETIVIGNGSVPSAAVDVLYNNGKLYVLYYEIIQGSYYNTHRVSLWCDGEVLKTFTDDADAPTDWQMCLYDNDMIVGGQEIGTRCKLWKNGEVYHTYDAMKITAMTAGNDGVYVATLNENWLPIIWRNDEVLYSFSNYIEFYGISVIQYDNISENIAENLVIYPNPVENLLTITGENLLRIEVVNLAGQTICSSECDGDEATIDMSCHPAGVYLINITNKNGELHTKKVVKE